jgi:hypothetical protein
VGLLHAGTHTVYDYRSGPYYTAENALWRAMIDDIPRGAIVLGDSYYGTIPDLALMQKRHLDLVTKLHGRRDPESLIRKGTRLGRDEWLVPFETAEATRRNQPDLPLPDVIWVRLIRHKFHHNGKRRTAWIVTTLLDPDAYPKSDVVALYRSRWGIETHLNYLKTTLDMSVLRSKSPAAMESELGAILLSHNLIYMLMNETSERCRCLLPRLSFAAAIKSALQNDGGLPGRSPSRQRCNRLLVLNRLAIRLNPDRPGRIEPRLIKRDLVRYPYLRTSRADARKAV